MVSLGRNILIPEYSFYTDFTNLTNEPQTIGIFGQGITQSTPFRYRYYQHCTGNVFLHFNSNLTTINTMNMRINYVSGGSNLFVVPAGTTRNQLLALLLLNTGRTWTYFEVPSMAGVGQRYFQFMVQYELTQVAVTTIQFTGPLVTFTMNTERPTFISDNFVGAKATTDIAELFRSQTGEIYNILAIGVNTEDSEQIDNPLTYFRQTAEGNAKQRVTPIVIDVDAYHTSILNVKVDWQIDGNSTILYDLQPGEEFQNAARNPDFGRRVRLYWTYVDVLSRDFMLLPEIEALAMAEKLGLQEYIDEIRFSKEYLLDSSAA